MTSERRDRMIKTQYDLIDYDKNTIIESTELIDYLQTFSHVEVNEENLFEILALVDLQDYKTTDQVQFHDVMTKEIVWPFNVEESVKMFQLFDSNQTGKIYWPRLEQYLKRFGIDLADGQKFQLFFGHEYLKDGYLDYASYYFNNFGLEINHQGEFIKQTASEDRKRISDEEEAKFRKEREALEEKVRAENTEKLKRKKDEKDDRKRKRSEDRTKMYEEDNKLKKAKEEIRESERLIKVKQEDDEKLKVKREGEKRQREEEELKEMQDARQRRQSEDDEKRRLDEEERLRKLKEEEERKRLEEERLRLEEQERKRLEEERLRLEEEERLRKLSEEEEERKQKQQMEDDERTRRDADNAKLAEDRQKRIEEGNKDPKQRELNELEEASRGRNIYWKGHYGGDTGKPTRLDFENFQQTLDGEIFGHGNDLSGDFTIVGKFESKSKARNPKVEFERQHQFGVSIKYTGTLVDGKIMGTCLLPDGVTTKKFEIECTGNDWKPPTKGPHVVPEMPKDICIRLIVDQDFVFGIGYTKQGNFLAKGTRNADTQLIKWAQVFFGSDVHIWEGKSEKLNEKKLKSAVTIIGDRYLQGQTDTKQRFALQGKYGQLAYQGGSKIDTKVQTGAQTPKVPESPAARPKDLRVAIPEQSSPHGANTPTIPDKDKAKQPSITKGITSLIKKEKEVTKSGASDLLGKLGSNMMSPTKPQIPKPPAKPKSKDPNEKSIDNLGANIKEYEILWTGKFTYENEGNAQKEKYWDNFQIDTDNICEGYGSDPAGDFEINGKLEFNGGKAVLNLVQNYTTIDFTMQLVGEFDSAGTVVGQWVQIDKETGEQRYSKGTWTMKACCQQWKGHFMENGQKVEMSVDLIVEDNFVYCASSNQIGYYLVKGNNNSETKEIVWAQFYGQSNMQIVFEGVSFKKSAKKKAIVDITGKYTNKGTGMTDDFALKGKYGQINKSSDSPIKLNKRHMLKQHTQEDPMYIDDIDQDEIPSLMQSTIQPQQMQQANPEIKEPEMQITIMLGQFEGGPIMNQIDFVNAFVEGDVGGQICRTQTLNDCEYEPFWNETLYFKKDLTEIFLVRVFHEGPRGQIEIGTASIDIEGMMANAGNNLQYELLSPDIHKKKTGTITIGFKQVE